MRETKFRGKDAITGEWVCGYYRLINYDMNVIYTFDDKEIKIMAGSQGEYTGVKVKNGEMCEGDIVKKHDEIISEHNNAIGIVEYEAGICSMGFHIRLIKGDDDAFYYPDGVNWCDRELEIIGNKFDNPELMEKK